jgi:hypothetical protein
MNSLSFRLLDRFEDYEPTIWDMAAGRDWGRGWELQSDIRLKFNERMGFKK